MKSQKLLFVLVLIVLASIGLFTGCSEISNPPDAKMAETPDKSFGTTADAFTYANAHTRALDEFPGRYVSFMAFHDELPKMITDYYDDFCSGAPYDLGTEIDLFFTAFPQVEALSGIVEDTEDAYQICLAQTEQAGQDGRIRLEVADKFIQILKDIHDHKSLDAKDGLDAVMIMVDNKGNYLEQGMAGTLISSYEYHTDNGKVWSEIGGIFADYFGSLFSPAIGALASTVYILFCENVGNNYWDLPTGHWGCHW